MIIRFPKLAELRDTDWTERKPFNDNGELRYYNFDELLAFTRPLFNTLMYNSRFYRFSHLRDDFFQECSLFLMRLYAAVPDFMPADIRPFIFVAYRLEAFKYLGKYIQKDKIVALSLDENISKKDKDFTLIDTLCNEDSYFPVIIDYSIFTDEENALIDRILDGRHWVKDEVYNSVRVKLVAYFRGEFDGKILTTESKKAISSRERKRRLRAALLAADPEGYKQSAREARRKIPYDPVKNAERKRRARALHGYEINEHRRDRYQQNKEKLRAAALARYYRDQATKKAIQRGDLPPVA